MSSPLVSAVRTRHPASIVHLSRLIAGACLLASTSACINIEGDQRPGGRPPTSSTPATNVPETERVWATHGNWTVRAHQIGGNFSRCTASQSSGSGMLRLHIQSTGGRVITVPRGNVPEGGRTSVAYSIGNDRWTVQSLAVSGGRLPFIIDDAILNRVQQGGSFVTTASNATSRWDLGSSARPAVDAMRQCASRRGV